MRPKACTHTAYTLFIIKIPLVTIDGNTREYLIHLIQGDNIVFIQSDYDVGFLPKIFP